MKTKRQWKPGNRLDSIMNVLLIVPAAGAGAGDRVENEMWHAVARQLRRGSRPGANTRTARLSIMRPGATE